MRQGLAMLARLVLNFGSSNFPASAFLIAGTPDEYSTTPIMKHSYQHLQLHSDLVLPPYRPSKVRTEYIAVLTTSLLLMLVECKYKTVVLDTFLNSWLDNSHVCWVPESWQGNKERTHTYSEPEIMVGSATCIPTNWNLSVFIRYITVARAS